MYVVGECSRAQKKGRSKMTHAMFFVVDEYGNQISDEYLGQINDFNSCSAAERAAREYSKKNPLAIYSVGVAINSLSFRNGRKIKEV